MQHIGKSQGDFTGQQMPAGIKHSATGAWLDIGATFAATAATGAQRLAGWITRHTGTDFAPSRLFGMPIWTPDYAAFSRVKPSEWFTPWLYNFPRFTFYASDETPCVWNRAGELVWLRSYRGMRRGWQDIAEEYQLIEPSVEHQPQIHRRISQETLRYPVSPEAEEPRWSSSVSPVIPQSTAQNFSHGMTHLTRHRSGRDKAGGEEELIPQDIILSKAPPLPLVNTDLSGRTESIQRDTLSRASSMPASLKSSEQPNRVTHYGLPAFTENRLQGFLSRTQMHPPFHFASVSSPGLAKPCIIASPSPFATLSPSPFVILNHLPSVIASEAKQSPYHSLSLPRLLQRYVPRNDMINYYRFPSLQVEETEISTPRVAESELVLSNLQRGPVGIRNHFVPILHVMASEQQGNSPPSTIMDVNQGLSRASQPQWGLPLRTPLPALANQALSEVPLPSREDSFGTNLPELPISMADFAEQPPCRSEWEGFKQIDKQGALDLPRSQMLRGYLNQAQQHDMSSSNTLGGENNKELFSALLQGTAHYIGAPPAELALAPLGRPIARSDEAPSPVAETEGGMIGGEQVAEMPTPDPETLAREVYAILKRRLAREREQAYGLS